MQRSFVPVFARWLFALSLALWLGGLLTIGALVAPVTAHFVDTHPALASGPAGKGVLLTAIVGGSLRVFNTVCVVCALLLLFSQSLLWRFGSARLSRPILFVTLALLAGTLYLAQSLFPAMDTAQAAGNMALFDTLHRRYEAVSTQLQFPALLLLALLAAARDTAPAPCKTPA